MFYVGMDRTTYKIKNNSFSLNYHIKRHHTKYILWWFSIFAIIKTFVFLFGYIASYWFFSQANNDFQDLYLPHQEVFSQENIHETFSQIFGSGSDGLLTEDKIAEMEYLLFGTEKDQSNIIWNLDEFDFDEVSDMLDLSKETRFAKNGKISKNVMLEKIQKNNKKIKIKIPKDVLVKKIKKDNPGKWKDKEQIYQ